MLRQVRLSEIAGKTVKAAGEAAPVYSGGFAISFTDGTFVQMQASLCYDSVSVDDADAVSIRSMGSDYVALGIVTSEELKADRRLQEEECARAQVDRERREFERLRKKFGG